MPYHAIHLATYSTTVTRPFKYNVGNIERTNACIFSYPIIWRKKRMLAVLGAKEWAVLSNI